MAISSLAPLTVAEPLIRTFVSGSAPTKCRKGNRPRLSAGDQDDIVAVPYRGGVGDGDDVIGQHVGAREPEQEPVASTRCVATTVPSFSRQSWWGSGNQSADRPTTDRCTGAGHGGDGFAITGKVSVAERHLIRVQLRAHLMVLGQRTS